MNIKQINDLLTIIKAKETKSLIWLQNGDYHRLTAQHQLIFKSVLK